MGFNTNQEERNKNIKRDLKDKLKFEEALKKDVRGFLDRVLSDFRSAYMLTNRPQNFDIYQQDMEALLRRSYLEVSDSFSDRISKGLVENAEEGDDTEAFFTSEQGLLLAALVTSDVRTFIDEQIKISSNSILNTTEKDLNLAIGAAILANQTSPLFVDNLDRATIINDAAVGFKDTFKRREDTIAMSEVENAAEGSKFIEAGAIVAIAIVETALKIWNVIRDGLQRLSHDEAGGQEVPVLQPFIVQGELLNHPRDGSLGASLNNLINCRCTISYVFRLLKNILS